MKVDYRLLAAYALGYYHGRALGFEDNKFEGDERALYGEGYERGVADYCEETHTEDEGA